MGGLCGNKSATNVASPRPHNSVSICGADFFQILIKSTIFGNKNNKCCFWTIWLPKCCWLKWCCCGTHIGGIRLSFPKKLRFLELPSWKRVPIDDLGGRNLLPILDSENMASKDVSHFSGLCLSFLFVKWGGFGKNLQISLQLDFDLIC